MAEELLSVSKLCKFFGVLQVTRSVDLTLHAGARHALIGPNGAGKTTLIHLMTGVLKPSSGTIRLFGDDITNLPAEARVRRGLVRTFQINSLFNQMTVAQNIALAAIARQRRDANPLLAVSDARSVAVDVERSLATLELSDLADIRIENLAYGQRRLVEIALALTLKPSVLLLDEPAAGITRQDSERLLKMLGRLPDDIAVLLIEHDMDLVFRFSKEITVLMEGGVLVRGDVQSLRSDPRVRDVYLGRRHHA